jgi:DNA repair exonuclease SbcCD ATPase subunit
VVDISSYRTKLNQLQGQKALLIKQRVQNQEKKEEHTLYLEHINKARAIVQAVAEATQRNLEWHISNIVSMALSSVFPDPYTFNLRFVQRRNKTEADLVCMKGENETDDLLNTSGGGTADVASFALRVAVWSIKQTRPIMLIDEAFRFLSLDLQEKASEMIKEIVNRLSIQVIMVSHLPGMVKAADCVINIENMKGVSYTKEEE